MEHSISDNIKFLMEDNNINSEELFEKFKRINPYVKKYVFLKLINGLVAFDLKTIEDISICLNCSEEDILFGEKFIDRKTEDEIIRENILDRIKDNDTRKEVLKVLNIIDELYVMELLLT